MESNIDIKQIYDGLNALWRSEDPDEIGREIIAENAVFHVSHPINEINGRDEIMSKLIRPIQKAILGCRRRDLMFFGGQNQRDYGGDWCASVTHYTGNFAHPLLNIQPDHHLVFLRAGEFYRIENGMIVEARLIFDFIDLMRQANQFPLPFSYGAELTFPAPATQDGLLPQGSGAASFACVEKMLSSLHVFDPKTMESPDQTGADGCWHPDMMWYGPAGIGSNFQWNGFVKDHRTPFLEAFPDRKGGNHYARIAQGNYVAVSGWPSMTMTWAADYLGFKADNRALTLRVMDFYRCADTDHGTKIMENWVLLDYGDLFRQMGHDVLQG